ncbi:MAG: DUF11 domain-containing protein [Anaerolineae bacterium]|nr:DUF11 domain-containing protein [Anaerolineae bacterium]
MPTKFSGFVSFIVLLVVIILLLVAAPVNSAPDPAKLLRPTVVPGDGGGGGGGTGGTGGAGGGVGSGDGTTRTKCASVVGQIINWGYGGEGGVTTELETGSWQISTISATDGNYGFGGLGEGVAVLHVALTPGQAEQFEPHLQDAGVYLNCAYPTIANIALASEPPLTPPATIQMSALHQVIPPGGGTEITLKLENTLPNDITNVVVTDLIPPGLIALDVSTSVEARDTQIINGPDGQLVAVYLERMAAGAKATIQITVIAAADLPIRTQLTNTATLFYRESAADQASLDFSIGSGGAPLLPTATTVIIPATPLTAVATTTPKIEPTPVSLEATSTPTPLASPPEGESSEEFVPPNGLPTTGEEFVPPGFLPVTGDTAEIPNSLPNTGLGLILPLSGLGLAGLAFLVHRLRSRWPQE